MIFLKDLDFFGECKSQNCLFNKTTRLATKSFEITELFEFFIILSSKAPKLHISITMILMPDHHESFFFLTGRVFTKTLSILTCWLSRSSDFSSAIHFPRCAFSPGRQAPHVQTADLDVVLIKKKGFINFVMVHVWNLDVFPAYHNQCIDFRVCWILKTSLAFI